MVLELTDHHQDPKGLKLNFRLSLPLFGDRLGSKLIFVVLKLELFDSLKELAYFLSHGAFFLLLDVFEMPLINELDMIEFLSDSQQDLLLVLMELRMEDQEVDDGGNFVVKGGVQLMMLLTLLQENRSVFIDLGPVLDGLVPLFELHLVEAIAVLLLHED